MNTASLEMKESSLDEANGSGVRLGGYTQVTCFTSTNFYCYLLLLRSRSTSPTAAACGGTCNSCNSATVIYYMQQLQQCYCYLLLLFTTAIYYCYLLQRELNTSAVSTTTHSSQH